MRASRLAASEGRGRKPESPFLTSCPSAASRPANDETCRVTTHRHRDVPAAAGGERRGKITLFPRSHGASGRKPESPFHTSVHGCAGSMKLSSDHPGTGVPAAVGGEQGKNHTFSP